MKTYPIAAAGGFVNPAALDSIIVPPTLNTASLSSIVVSLLSGSEGLLCIVVDLAARKIRAKAAVAGGTNVYGDVANGEGIILNRIFEKDDLTTARSTFTVTGLADFTIEGGSNDPLQDLVKPESPLLTSAQLVGLAEDAMLTVGGPLEGVPIVIVLDQGVPRIRVATFDTPENAALSYAAMAATIGYDQTPTVNGGASARQPLE